jgi:hypothetical protein
MDSLKLYLADISRYPLLKAEEKSRSGRTSRKAPRLTSARATASG